jgi:hypothetical protein
MTPTPLQTFGAAPSPNIRIRASLQLSAQRALVRFEIEDPEGELLWPAPATKPARQEELWKHTCFELFLRDPTSGQYWEWNFSPSGDWGCFAFDSYRSKLPTQGPQGLAQFRLEGWGGVSYLECEIDLSFSPTLSFLSANHKPIEYQLTAVGELQKGGLTYWALAHASSKADFHAAEAFRRY